ncbi:hypothetical protein PS3A_18790 [Pseudomonas sp. 3A(2025)]
MSNTLQQILARLSQGTVTQGWGAIAVFSGERLNALLEQQFVAAFARPGSDKLLNAETFLGDDDGLVATLENVQLGPPVLSFPSTPLSDARVRLTFKLLSGRYQVHSRNRSVPRTVHTTFTINETQGLVVELDIALKWVLNAADRLGRVRLDLADTLTLSCNLAGSDTQANERLAVLLKDTLAQLPSHQRVYVLGLIHVWRDGPLAVQEVRIQTQAAPGSRIRGAVNHGAGAVVVMLRLWADSTGGTYPLNSGFPYLIPDDPPPGGGQPWSASLILGAHLIEYVVSAEQRLLDSVQFSGGQVLERLVTERPYDHVLFGRISPGLSTVTLEPAFATVHVGGSQDFTLRDGAGQPVAVSHWQAASFESSRPVGHGSIVNGRYTAVSLADIGHEMLHVTITADYEQDGQTHTASALVTVVVFDDLSVSPRLGSYLKPVRAQPIDLAAFTIGGEAVQWSQRGTHYGELAETGARTALFEVEEQQVERKALVAQQIEATGRETSPATLLFVNGQSLLGLEPHYTTHVGHASQVALHDDPSVLPGLPRRWSVMGGPGSVNDEGEFTSPADKRAASSIVQCQVVHNDVVFCNGYSVVDLLDTEEDPAWISLEKFTVEVRSGGESQKGTLYGNGYQQLEVVVKVQSTQYLDHDSDVTDAEMRTLKLAIAGSHLPFIGEDGDGQPVEGIPEDGLPGQRWQVNRQANTYKRAGAQSSLEDPSAPGTTVKSRTFYLQARAPDNVVAKITATFESADNGTQYSERKTESTGTIEVTIKPAPVFGNNDYTLERTRIPDSAAQSLAEPDDEDFDLYLNTTDYWQLTCDGNRHGLKRFKTLEFFATDALAVSRSMIRWESELLWETMFSYTGYIFDPEKKGQEKQVLFDEAIKDVVENKGLLECTVNTAFYDEGSLVITLHRHDEVKYVHGTKSRDKLYRPLHVKLRDEEGSLHYRTISFNTRASGSPDRNRIGSTSATPPVPQP